jgi:hypothetical protein
MAVELDDVHRSHVKDHPSTVLANFVLDPEGDCNFISLDVLEALGYKGSKEEDAPAWVIIHDMMTQCRILPRHQASRLCHQFLVTNELYYYYCGDDLECTVANRE